MRFNEENPGVVQGPPHEEGIPMHQDDEVPPPAPPPSSTYQQHTMYQNGHAPSVGIGAPGGPPLPIYPQHQQTGKVHLVPSQPYRNYAHIGNDVIPEEPEQYDLPPPPPPSSADWKDGSLV